MLISDLGEGGLVKEIQRLFLVDSDDIKAGIGDDAAVIDVSGPGRQAWTTDILIEGIHFDTSWQEPEELGRKSLLANISDLAAMGARPGYALLSLGVPRDCEVDYIIAVCRGIRSEADSAGISVVGGDTTASPAGIVINVALMGTVEGRYVTRSGANPGDALVVTGELGGAAAGLKLLQVGKAKDYPGLVKKFLIPPNRIETAQAAVTAGATAMTDISDGLAEETHHLCEASGVGMRIDAARLPMAPDLDAACGRFGWVSSEIMLSGGEEYELLITLPESGLREQIDAISSEEDVRVTVIGKVVSMDSGIALVDKAGSESSLQVGGYQHFSHE